MKSSLLICLSLLLLNNIKAQETFNKYVFKKRGNLLSQLFDNSNRTNTGGYAYTEAAGDNAYISVMDSNFNIEWARSLNFNNNKSFGITVAQSAIDSSFVVAGTIAIAGRPEHDIFIETLSKSGKLLSAYAYNYDGGGPMKLIALEDGNFLLAASEHGHCDIIILDSKARPLTIRSLSYDIYTFLGGFQHLNKGGYIMTGNLLYNVGNGQRDIFCAKFDEQLNLKWTKLYISGNEEEVNDIIETMDEGFLTYGFDAFPDGRSNARIFKLDSLGNIEWHKTGHLLDNFFPNSAVQCKDSGYVMAGFTIYKIDKYGEVNWISDQYRFGQTNPIFKTKDEGLVTFSQVLNDSLLYTIKLDSSGKSCNSDFAYTYTALPDSLSVEDKIFTVATNDAPAVINSGVVITAEDSVENVICATGVLPLTLTSFTAVHNGKQNNLSWLTANELNISFYEIERSNDGNSFIKLGVVKANNSNTNTYRFSDLFPKTGANFYRLKVVEKNGKNTYSETKMLLNNEPGDFYILSNPVHNTLMLSGSSLQTKSLQLRIVNMQGVAYKIISLKGNGSFTKAIDASGLPAGIYFIEITSASKHSVLKFLKQ